MKLIKERSISVVFDSVSISKDIVVEGGPLTQNFYADSQSFIPNRFLTPITLTPKIYITDPNKVLESGDKHKELVSCIWYEGAEKIVDGDEYKISKDNVLTVLKNSEKDFVISYEAVWYDPRKKQNITIEDSVQFITISLGDGNTMPRLILDKPQNWIHNPLKEERIYTIKAQVSRDKLYDGAVEWYYRPKNGIKDQYIDNTMLFYAGGQLTNELKVDSAYMNDCIITAKNLSSDKLKQYYWFFDSKGNPLNTDEPTYTDIEGSNVISLPNNAMKSVAPCYKFEGLTLNNLIKNGDFKDELKYWDYIHDVTASINKNGFVEIIPKKPYGSLEQTVIGNKNDLFYFKFDLDSMETLPEAPEDYVNNYSLGFNSQINGFIKDLKYSNILTKTTSTPVLCGLSVASFIYTKFVLKSIIVVNLTQAFGAGNEPSKEWCDKHIQGYFEGVKSVQTPMRVKSDVGRRNLFIGGKKINVNGFTGLIKFSGFLKKDTNYTIHFNILEANTDKDFKIYFYDIDTNPLQMFLLPKGIGKKELVFTPEVDLHYIRLYASDTAYEGTTTSYENIKIEEGSVATPWTPAPEDNLPPQGGALYINNQLELKSVGTAKDYIENGKLYKNISDDGEILENQEVINLDTSGLITNHPNGTIFIEPIIKKDFIYTTHISINDNYKVNYIESIKKGTEDLDITKAIIKDNKVTHPDLSKGDFGTIIYNYDNSPILGNNTISYLSLEDMLDTLWLENIYTYKAKLGEDGTVTEWELVKLIDIENYEEWLSQRKESPSQLAPDGIILGKYKANTKFLRQFPSSLYVDFIAPDRLKEGITKVKVRALVGTKDEVIENPSRYFKITWLKRAIKPGQSDKVIGYGNEITIDVGEKDAITIEVEDLGILKALTDENGKYLTNEENKIIVGR